MTLIKDLERYKNAHNVSSRSKVIIDLLKYVLSLPPFFADFNWEKAEKEADEEIKKGQTRSFDSTEDFLKDLKS